MLFNKLLNEVVGGRLSDTKSGNISKEIYTLKQDQATVPIADFDIEIIMSNNEYLVGGKVKRSSDNQLKNYTISRTTTKKFVEQLAKDLKSKGYKIDINSFKEFFSRLKDKAIKGKTRNKAFAYSAKDKTKENPNPQWDAYFRLERKGGQNNTLSFSDLEPTIPGNQLTKWHKSGEIEKAEKPKLIDRFNL